MFRTFSGDTTYAASLLGSFWISMVSFCSRSTKNIKSKCYKLPLTTISVEVRLCTFFAVLGVVRCACGWLVIFIF